MRIEHTIKVDFQRPGVRPVVRIVEGDASTRYIVANLYSGGEPFSVGTGVTGVVKYAKSDGHSGVYDTIDKDKATEHAAVVFHDNSKQAVIELAPNISMGFGLVALIVQFVETSGTDILGTFPVDVIVERDPTDGTEAEDYFSYKALDELYAAIDEAEARISTNTQAIRGTERRLDGVDTSITAMDDAVVALDRRVTSLGVDLSHQINAVAADAHVANMTAEKAVTDAHSAVTIAQLTESQLSIVSGDAAKAMADAAKALAAGQQDITDEYNEAKKSRPTLTVDAFLLEQADGLYRINAANGQYPYTARVVTDTFGQTHMDVVEYSQSDRIERSYIDSTLITTVSMNVQDGAVEINPETLVVELATARSQISALQAENVALRNRVDTMDSEIKNLIVAGDGKIYSTSVDSSETYTKIVPANALPNAVLDSIGGKSVVLNQLVDQANVRKVNGTYTVNADGSIHAVYNGTGQFKQIVAEGLRLIGGHTYMVMLDNANTDIRYYLTNISGGSSGFELNSVSSATSDSYIYLRMLSSMSVGLVDDFNYWAVDLTKMFGEGNEPTTVEQAYAMGVPQNYIPYNAGEIVSADVQSINASGKTPEPIPYAIRNLPGYGWSAGSVYNEVDYANKQYIQRVARVDLGDLSWVAYNTANGYFLAALVTLKTGTVAILTDRGYSAKRGISYSDLPDHCVMATVSTSSQSTSQIWLRDSALAGMATAEVASTLNGSYVYYELAEPIITDISNLFPANFGVLPVEDSGTVTFRQAGGTTLPVPSTITFPVKIGGDSV